MVPWQLSRDKRGMMPHDGVMKWFDLPPIWLALMAFLTWHSRGPLGGLDFGDRSANWIGAALVLLGIALTVLAILRMRSHRTTPIPHMQPSALVTDGVFAISRNPIYLGDLFILIGFILRWNAPLAVPLVFVFFIILDRRFVRPEEARMREHFREEFEQYAKTTRRWI